MSTKDSKKEKLCNIDIVKGIFKPDFFHEDENDGIKRGDLYPDNSIISYMNGEMLLKQHTHFACGEVIPDEWKLRK